MKHKKKGLNRYMKKYNINPPLNVCKYRLEDHGKELLRNQYSLALLLQQNPQSYKGVRFTCETTILSVNRYRDWYYTSCIECTSKVRNDNGVWECVDHGPLPEPTYRHNFKVFVSDETAKGKTGAVDFTLNDVLEVPSRKRSDCNTKRYQRLESLGTPSSSDSAKVQDMGKVASKSEPRTRSVKRPAFSSSAMEAKKRCMIGPLNKLLEILQCHSVWKCVELPMGEKWVIVALS
ncbi:nucleic acid-binding, OB-fold protein [Artemisia annua]|uniref:Nucleic acid-binding, OB-fold protein n=1 Tax=Artemisia annua TaxID=35608 RepID=A0A2U1KRA9_ARTAN|nr:nucleic acid-binding, OB-fold protein [Artemisia annua]